MIAIALLPFVAVAGLFALVVVKDALLPGPTPILTEFVERLHDRSRELMSSTPLSIYLPALAEDEMVVVAMNLYATWLNDSRLSTRAHEIINDDAIDEGAGKTFLYHVNKGEIRGRLSVSQCNLAIKPGVPLIITPSNKAIALECGPVVIPSRPDECRRVAGLWNAACTARLVVE